MIILMTFCRRPIASGHHRRRRAHIWKECKIAQHFRFYLTSEFAPEGIKRRKVASNTGERVFLFFLWQPDSTARQTGKPISSRTRFPSPQDCTRHQPSFLPPFRASPARHC